MDPSLKNALIFAGVACAGMIAHYVKAWAKGEIAGNLIDYLFRDNARSTVLAFGGVLAAAATAYVTGTLTGLNLQALILSAFTTGFSLDSTLNKSATAVPAAPLGSIPTGKQGGFARINLLLAVAMVSVTGLLLFGLGGCASVSVPNKPSEAVAGVQVLAAAGVNTADSLYLAGKISKAEAQTVLNAAKTLTAVLAQVSAAGDQASAQALLSGAAYTAALDTLTQFLAAHPATSP